MTLGQATEILELHNHLTPEVLQLMQFLESQHLGRLGRAASADAGRDDQVILP